MFEVKKRVYCFGGKTAEGDGSMRELLGGKGANLAEMSRLGMPVPAGFTITTECCAEYYELGGGYTEDLRLEVSGAMAAMEKIMGKKFGDPKDPLLVSCRSGARSSMPGMMDTILNIGLCSETIPGMIEKTGNPRFVYDAYRRLIMMYSDVVMEKAEGIEPADGQGIRQQLDRMMNEVKDILPTPNLPSTSSRISATGSRSRSGRCSASSSPTARKTSSGVLSAACSSPGTERGR